jgi:hypothetical protein
MMRETSTAPEAHSLDVAAVDLADLVRRLAQRVPPDARLGELTGRTIFRDATVEVLSCSSLEAEELVDTLIWRRFLVFEPAVEPGAPGVWQIRANAS